MRGLTLDSVSFNYVNGRGINVPEFYVEPGEIVAICGKTGSGKTTLIRILNGLIPHFHRGTFEGRVLLDEEDITNLGPKERLRLGIATVFQFPEDQLMPGRVKNFASERFLSLMHASHLLEKSIHTLSGGEKQRVAIAMAAERAKKALLLDEPLSQLDEQGVRCLRSLIEELSALGVSIVISEHRVKELIDIIDRVYAFNSDVLIEVEKSNIISRINAGKRPRTELGDVLLEVREIRFRYGKKWIIDGLSFEVSSGGIVIILGDNGSGKTTLLKLLAGLLKPVSGEIILMGKKVKNIKNCAKHVMLIPQNPEEYFVEPTVEAELSFSALIPGSLGDVKDAIDFFGLRSLLHRSVLSLSGGEKLLVALATAYVRNPKILLLDETTRGLDSEEKAKVIRLLWELSMKGKALIIATNDKEFADALDPDLVVKLPENCVVIRH